MPIPIGLREITLTEEQAQELLDMIAHPRNFPTFKPRAVPMADAMVIEGMTLRGQICAE